MSGTSCTCCAGGRHLAPGMPWNAPGRDALDRRIARYPDALDRMIAGLSDARRPALGHLTTRDPSDPSIALLDVWACLEDVITFYDERIANEGYLRTATDRDALAGIAALVGYRPRPGVAASTWFAFEMEADHAARLEAGIRVRSVPKPGKQAQTFESIEDLEARADLNELLPQSRRPQIILFDDALTVDVIWLEGAIKVSPGDPLLLYWGEEAGRQILRTVRDASEEQDASSPGLVAPRTRVRLAPVHHLLQEAFTMLLAGVGDDAFDRVVTHLALGAGPAELLAALPAVSPSPAAGPPAKDPFADVRDNLKQLLEVPVEDVPDERKPIGLAALLDGLRPHPAPIGHPVIPAPSGPDDRAARLIGAAAGIPAARLQRAWQAAESSTEVSVGARVFALRQVVGLFGHNAPPEIRGEGEVRPWPVASDEADTVLHLETRLAEVTPGTHLVIRCAQPQGDGNVLGPMRRMHRMARSTSTINRFAYGLAGASTLVEVSPRWWSVSAPKQSDTMLLGWMQALRATTVYCASEPLSLADELDETPFGACSVLVDTRAVEPPIEQGSEPIRLDRLVAGIEPGRTVIVTGTRAVVEPGAGGDPTARSLDVPVSELATVIAVTHDKEEDRPDGPIRTTIWLAAPLRECYVRSSVRILANVAPATHGETRTEILGNGDAQLANQTFRTQPGLLTHVADDSVTGVTSTLEVRVDDVRWREVDPSDQPGPADHAYTTAPAGVDRTLIRFGDGVEGARPRSGQQNMRARYRVGIGPEANVDADAITTLVTRPLGLKAVTNPVPATGGAGPDSPDEIRARAPIGVTALGRLISVQDHADFAAAFAGVAKAVATTLPIAGRSSVHVTIAAPLDATIDPDGILVRRLRGAFRRYGDPLLPVSVAPSRRVLLVLAASIRLRPGYRWTAVEAAVRAALGRAFGFARRSLAQDALLSEVIDTIAAVAGVDYVDVDGWGSLDPRAYGASLEDMATALQQILAPPTGRPVERLAIPAASLGEAGTVLPAVIAYLDPSLPETLVLREVSDGR
jgi:hypothetical protein